MKIFLCIILNCITLTIVDSYAAHPAQNKTKKEKKQCPHCGRTMMKQGFGMHIRFCGEKLLAENKNTINPEVPVAHVTMPAARPAADQLTTATPPYNYIPNDIPYDPNYWKTMADVAREAYIDSYNRTRIYERAILSGRYNDTIPGL